MNQFATMLPVPANSTMLKAEAAQEDLAPDGTGLSFAETLQELSDTNPNAAALLLALQQAGVSPQLPISPQLGGSSLPFSSGGDGNGLPLPQLQSLQANAQQELPMEALQSLDARQLQQLLGGKPLQEAGQLLSQAIGAGRLSEALQTLESRIGGDFSSQLQGLGLNLQGAQAVAGQRLMPALPVQVPVGQPGWDGALGERVQWMVSQNVQQAEIKLTPPELGPMEIRLSIQNDQTNVHFVASHSATRDALEAAIPRLRELFGEINLNLANVDVNQRDAGGAAQSGSGGADRGSEAESSGEGYEPGESRGSAQATLQGRGLLDTYA